MIYVQIKPVISQNAATVPLSAVADIIDASRRIDPDRILLDAAGGRVDAMDVLRAIECAAPGESVQLVGDTATLIKQPKKPVPKWILNAVAAVICVFLFLGSGMAITYFHSDVDMEGAQQTLLRAMLDDDEPHPWIAAIPYALGVGLGAAVFLSPRGTPSPLAIKMSQQKQEADEYEVAQAATQSGEAPDDGTSPGDGTGGGANAGGGAHGANANGGADTDSNANDGTDTGSTANNGTDTGSTANDGTDTVSNANNDSDHPNPPPSSGGPP